MNTEYERVILGKEKEIKFLKGTILTQEKRFNIILEEIASKYENRNVWLGFATAICSNPIIYGAAKRAAIADDMLKEYEKRYGEKE